MAKKIYVGLEPDGKAQRIYTGYIGIPTTTNSNGIAHRIIKGYVGVPNRATNLLTNGALSSNTDGWDMQSTSVYTCSYVDNALRITAKQVADVGLMYANYQVLSDTIMGSRLDNNRVVYICANVRGSTSNVGGRPLIFCHAYLNSTTSSKRFNIEADINGISGLALNDDKWHTFSGIYNTYDSASGNSYEFYRVAFGISPDNNDTEQSGQVVIGDIMDIKNFCVFDLTDIFGRGNEPTKEWCDANLVGYPDGRDTENGRGVARQFFGGDNKGDYWVFTTTGVNKFNSDGTIENLGDINSFFCKSSGSYKLELHGGGGGAGGGAHGEGMAWSGDEDAYGGNGGGSGAQWIVTLKSGTLYDFSVGKGGKGGYYSSGSYSAYGDSGTTGGTTVFGSYSITGGVGGTGGSCHGSSSSNGGGGARGEPTPSDTATNLASSGKNNAGTGGSSIGNYGTGGEGGYKDGEDGQDGVIILTKL